MFWLIYKKSKLSNMLWSSIFIFIYKLIKSDLAQKMGGWLCLVKWVILHIAPVLKEINESINEINYYTVIALSSLMFW